LLYRAFLNIMLNAAQALNQEGILWVRVVKEKDYYEVEIEDNGAGISPENMQKIFILFHDQGAGNRLGPFDRQEDH